MKKLTFSQKCYKLLKKIPKGKVSTYKWIAEKLNTKAYQAVGNAIHKNKNLMIIPCYKVINNNGCLGGYSKGINKKIKLLKNEGIEIKNNKIDLKKYEWFSG